MTASVRVGGETLHRSVGGETVLLNLRSGECLTLDDIGQRTWELLVDRGDREQVAAKLIEEFEGDPGVIRADLDEFLGELVDRGLIEIDR